MLYRLEYTHTYDSVVEDIIEYFEASSEANAILEKDARCPEGATDIKLYVIGTKIIF